MMRFMLVCGSRFELVCASASSVRRPGWKRCREGGSVPAGRSPSSSSTEWDPAGRSLCYWDPAGRSPSSSSTEWDPAGRSPSSSSTEWDPAGRPPSSSSTEWDRRLCQSPVRSGAGRDGVWDIISDSVRPSAPGAIWKHVAQMMYFHRPQRPGTRSARRRGWAVEGRCSRQRADMGAGTNLYAVHGTVRIPGRPTFTDLNYRGHFRHDRRLCPT